MKVWGVAIGGHVCGGRCGGTVIGQGEVYLAIELAGVTTPKRRCVACALALYGLTPPDDLTPPPAAPPREPDPVHPDSLRRFASVGSMRRLQRIARRPGRGPRPVPPFDPKMAAAGRDD